MMGEKIPGQSLRTVIRGQSRNFLPLLFLVLVLTGAQRTSGPDAAIRLNNLGVGYMNQARMAEALQMFRRAQAQDPSLSPARLNEGIGLLNLQRVADGRDVLLDTHGVSEVRSHPRFAHNFVTEYVPHLRFVRPVCDQIDVRHARGVRAPTEMMTAIKI